LDAENASLVGRITQMRGALEALTRDNADLRQTIAEMHVEILRLQNIEARSINADRESRIRSMHRASMNP
jgi:hypothetical protein